MNAQLVDINHVRLQIDSIGVYYAGPQPISRLEALAFCSERPLDNVLFLLHKLGLSI